MRTFGLWVWGGAWMAAGAGAAAPPVEPMSYEGLVRLIRHSGATTVEEVLRRLPPSYLEHHTLIHQSRSLQGASARYPRVIVFGRTGDFILTFNGHPSQRGFHSLEAIQYRATERRFEFRRILFPDSSTGEVTFSDANPPLCLACHQSDPRPNWAFYNQWPGAYGADDDVPRGEELDRLRRFHAESAAHDRYRFLPRPSGSAASPYEEKPQGRLRFRPNLRLMALLFGRNADRLHRIFQQHPHYRQWRFTFIMSRLRCEFQDLDPEAELTRLFGEKAAASPIGHWSAVTGESLFAFLIRAVGLSDADFTMNSRSSNPYAAGWGPYSYYLGAARFDRWPMLQADPVAARMTEELAEEWSPLRPFVIPHAEARLRFAREPDDLVLAGPIDDRLRSVDFGRLREACGLLGEEYRKRYGKAGGTEEGGERLSD